MKKARVLSYTLSAKRRLWSDWADAQADLSLRWAHNHIVGFVMRRLMSILPLSFQNPQWLFGWRPDWWRCSFKRFARFCQYLASNWQHKDTPMVVTDSVKPSLLYSNVVGHCISEGSPFRFLFYLYLWIMDAPLNSTGISSFLHM